MAQNYKEGMHLFIQVQSPDYQLVLYQYMYYTIILFLNVVGIS